MKDHLIAMALGFALGLAFSAALIALVALREIPKPLPPPAIPVEPIHAPREWRREDDDGEFVKAEVKEPKIVSHECLSEEEVCRFAQGKTIVGIVAYKKGTDVFSIKYRVFYKE